MRRRVESVLCVFAALTVVAAAAVASTSPMPSEKEPRAQYAPDRIIVGFATDVNVYTGLSGKPVVAIGSVDDLNARFGVKRIDPVHLAIATRKMAAAGLERQLGNAYVLTFSSGADPVDVAACYANLPEVRYAEPDYIRHTLRTDPNDPYWPTSNSWGQGYRDQWDMEITACPAAWDVQTGSASAVIAVSDTGVDYSHPDIAANMWHNPGEVPGNGIDDDGNGRVDDYYGYDFYNSDADPMDDNGHGTHCAGTIGSVGNNSLGISGINWHCSVMAVKGLSSGGSGFDSNLAPGITYAADEGADVISMSWGGGGRSQTIHDALVYAHDVRNVVLVVAGGNSNTNITGSKPAWDNYCITVAASDPADAKCDFSNWGIKTAVAAPGGGPSGSTPPCAQYNCLSLRAGSTDLLSGSCGAGVGVVGTNYYRLAGTSMACPHVAGLAGLILAQNPGWTNEQVRQAIQMRADDILTTGFDRYSGFGRINAYGSVTSPEPVMAFISSPDNAGKVWDPLTVLGTAAGPNFSSYTLDCGLGYEPTSWTTIATSSTPVTGGTLATWDPTTLAPGMYTLRLRTAGTGGVQNAEYRIEITVASPQGSGHFTELFDTTSFDLDNSSLTFTPDGSPEFYSLCRTPIASLPTDPAGGTALSLGDDSFASVTLTGGAQVSIYGNIRSTFYVGSNGYITLDSGDSSLGESFSQHFALKRVSALFDDLYPSSGSVTWKQLADRAVVTFLDVPEYGSSNQNTFQIEMFFDGKIVISYLAIAAIDGLAGISAGGGIPPGFAPSDLSSYGPCIIPGRTLHIVSPNGGEWYEPGTIVQIHWTAVGTDWLPGDTAALEYSSNGGAGWSAIPGAASLAYNAGSFDWDTTGLPESSQYRVRVVFNGDTSINDASDANSTIAPDIVPPIIVHTPLADTGNTTGPYSVCATVTDNLGVGAVTLYWNKNGGAFVSVPMTASGTPNQYCADIPGPSAVGDSYCYYIEATDISAAANTSRSPATGENCFNVTSRLQILSYIQYSDNSSGGEYRNALSAIGCPFDNAELANSANLATAIVGKDVLLIPEQENTSLTQMQTIGTAWRTILESFLSGGGRIVVCDFGGSGAGGSYGVLTAAGLMSISSATGITEQSVTVSDPSSPIAAGVTSPYTAMNGSLSFTTTETGVVVRTVSSSAPVVIAKPIAAGHVILIGHDFFSSNASQNQLVSNAVCARFAGRTLHLTAPNGGEFYEPGNTVPITWTATGADWSGGDTVRLEYSTDGGISWDPTPIAPGEAYNAGLFDWDTTGVPESDQYRVRVVFNGDDTIKDASDANFTIAPDIVPPIIVHTPLADTGNTTGPYNVCATVTDNLGVGAVTLYWNKNGGSFSSVPMTASGTPNEYCADIPGPSTVGDSYCYYMEATDVAATPNTARSPATGEHCFSIVVPAISLPTDLFDGDAYRWDIQGDGSISDGSSDAFDGGFRLTGFPVFGQGMTEDGGREIVIGPGTVSGATVTRKIYVPTSQAYCRFLEIVTNPGATAISFNVSLYTNLGSDSGTVQVQTSDPDYAVFDTQDNWIVTDDIDAGWDPTVLHVIAGVDSPVRPSSASRSGDAITYSYNLILAPGETKIVMHFGAQSQNQATALAKAPQIASLDPLQDCLAGMSSAELDQIVNFPVSPRGLRLTAPNGGQWYEPGNTVPITWTATGPDWQSGDTVRLEYSTDGGISWDPTPIAPGEAYNAGSFDWDTTGVPESDQYRVRVVFNGDDTIKDASDANFTIAPDIVPPIIVHTPLVDTGDQAGPYSVCATVTDNLGVGAVTLYWNKNGGAFVSVPMTASGTPNQYCADIPGPSAVGDSYCYYIEATDVAGTPNTAREPATGENCFNIMDCRPPAPTNPSPADGAPDVSVSTALSWNNDDGPPPPPLSGGSNTSKQAANAVPTRVRSAVESILQHSGIYNGPLVLRSDGLSRLDTGGEKANPTVYSKAEEIACVRSAVEVGIKTTSTLDVVICGTGEGSWNADVQAKLLSTGKFNTVSIISVNAVTPTLVELQAFDAALVYSGGGSYQNTVGLGDVMADYVDAGGGIVCMVLETGYDDPSYTMQGRWASAGYFGIPRTGYTYGSSTYLGVIHDPGHPILNGVSTFDGGSGSYRPSSLDVVEGWTRVADWSDGRPLVVTKDIGTAHRADLCFFPVSSDMGSDFWQVSTDGALLMGNSLVYVSGQAAYSVSYDVYMGDSCGNMTRVASDLNQPTYDPPGNLQGNATYYWKVVAKNSCGETEGPCWSFTTADCRPPVPTNPNPADGAADVSVSTALSWGGGGGLAIRSAGTSLLQNGGFETGDFTGWTIVTGPGNQLQPWTLASTGGGYFGNGTPSEGTYFAQNGFDGDAGLYYDIYQEVTIPSAATSARLEWSDRLQWDTPGATVARSYAVTLQPAGGGASLATLFSTTLPPGTTGDTGYVAHSIDLLEVAPGVAGQTVRINFHESIPETYTGPAQFDLDGVSLTVVEGGTTYDVYMGPSCDDLSPIASDLNQPTYDPPGNLQGNATYYWKVVAKNSCGETEGPCWSFTTADCRPPVPTNPNPADGAADVSVSTALSWNNDDGPPPPPLSGGSKTSEFAGWTTVTGSRPELDQVTVASARAVGSLAHTLVATQGELMIDAYDRGWWRNDGLHDASNKNTFTGQSDTQQLHSFFVFDLSSVPPGSVTVATLRLEIENYYGPDPSESLTIYDVSTPVSVLTSSGTDVAVFNDLGSGNSYGSFTVAPTNVGSIVEIALNGQALTDIGAAAGGYFALGLKVDDIGLPSGSEAVRFSAGSEARVHQLVLSTAGGGSTTYDVYMGDSCGNMTKIATDLTQPTYDPPGSLQGNATYYWKVVAKNICGETEGPCWSFTTESPTITKPADGTSVEVRGAIVSAAFPDFFYIEMDTRECGIRAQKPAHGLTTGTRVNVAGVIWTNADGERYIAASSVTQLGSAGISPLGMCNRALGGGDWQYDAGTKAGQKGITDASGLNNIGLLVTIWGKVTASGSGPRGLVWFYIDDGSNVQDGTGIAGVYCEVQSGVATPAVGAYVFVVGISSCEFYEGNLVNVLRVRDQQDIVIISVPLGQAARNAASSVSARPRDVRKPD